MKKLILMMALLVGMTCSAMAREYTTTNVAELPQKAQTFLKNNFKKSINHIKVEKKVFGSDEYDVILNDGSEIEFDGNGTWKSIDCGASAVPSSVVPKAISTFVSQNYKGQKIVEIEVEHSGYDIQLSNGIELKFNRAGEFLRVDD